MLTKEITIRTGIYNTKAQANLPKHLTREQRKQHIDKYAKAMDYHTTQEYVHMEPAETNWQHTPAVDSIYITHQPTNYKQIEVALNRIVNQIEQQQQQQ
jgi:hypothetical protein